MAYGNRARQPQAPRPYPLSPAGVYRLYKAGRLMLTDTEVACWMYVQRECCYSLEHALRYEGWRMVPVEAGTSTSIV